MVDDIGYSRHFHARLLQKFGYETEAAETGPQALKLLERDPSIEAVLTDLMMRDMDGVELFQRAQQLNRSNGADAPAFILMRALRPGKDQSQIKYLDKVRQAKDIGFVDVLYKPIEPDALKNTLATIKYARSRPQVDTNATLQKVGETIERLNRRKTARSRRAFSGSGATETRSIGSVCRANGTGLRVLSKCHHDDHTNSRLLRATEPHVAADYRTDDRG